MEHEIAKKIVNTMLDSVKAYNELLFEIQERCTEEEFKIYQSGFGSVMGYIFLDVLTPIFKEHPDLKPKEFE